jgi:hypothetical protein
MRADWTRWLKRAGWLMLAGVAVSNAGCLLAAAGVAAGGAATYLYLDAPVDRVYPADLADVRNATVSALQDLSMPVVSEEQNNGAKDIVFSRASDAEKVKIKITSEPSRVPGEQSVTRVSVRVSVFGDKEFSDRVLNQISAHMAYGTAPPPVPPPQPGVVQSGWQPPGAISTVVPPPPPKSQTTEPPK